MSAKWFLVGANHFEMENPKISLQYDFGQYFIVFELAVFGRFQTQYSKPECAIYFFILAVSVSGLKF